MNANDKLIDNNWIYYISGSCFLIYVPKAANLHSPTRIRRHFWKRGYFSAVFQKVCIPKVLKRCKKSCVLYWVCAVWWMTSFHLKTTARFSALFSSTHRKKTIRRFQNHHSGDGFLKPCATFFVSRKRHFVPSIRVLAIFGGNLRIQSTCGRGHGFTIIKLYWSCYEVVRIEETGNHVNCFLQSTELMAFFTFLFSILFYFIFRQLAFITQAPRVSYLQVTSDVSCFFGTPGPDSVGESFPFVIIQSSLWSLMMSETRKDK